VTPTTLEALVSKLKMTMVFAFLVCSVAVGISQDNADNQTQAPAAAPQTVSVPASIMTGMVEHKVLPQYPKEAMIKGIQGDVVFKIVVDENGKIVHSEPVSGDPLLVAAAEDAIRNYRFRPYIVNGSPTRVESQLGFHFIAVRKGDSTQGQVECMSTIP
jgi:TonB family protein